MTTPELVTIFSQALLEVELLGKTKNGSFLQLEKVLFEKRILEAEAWTNIPFFITHWANPCTLPEFQRA